MTEEEDYSAQRNFLGVALPVILDARRTCRYPHVDSHSSLRKYSQILPFGERQVLPFQNYKTSTTYYTYVYGFGFFSSRRTVPEKKYYYGKTSAHDRTWYYGYSTYHCLPSTNFSENWHWERNHDLADGKKEHHHTVILCTCGDNKKTRSLWSRSRSVSERYLYCLPKIACRMPYTIRVYVRTVYPCIGKPYGHTVSILRHMVF